jgi:hypothetical protein
VTLQAEYTNYSCMMHRSWPGFAPQNDYRVFFCMRRFAPGSSAPADAAAVAAAVAAVFMQPAAATYQP